MGGEERKEDFKYMRLGKKQEAFSEMHCSLMTYVLSQGYGMRVKH